jgi:hypothetical protein
MSASPQGADSCSLPHLGGQGGQGTHNYQFQLSPFARPRLSVLREVRRIDAKAEKAMRPRVRRRGTFPVIAGKPPAATSQPSRINGMMVTVAMKVPLEPRAPRTPSRLSQKSASSSAPNVGGDGRGGLRDVAVHCDQWHRRFDSRWNHHSGLAGE